MRILSVMLGAVLLSGSAVAQVSDFYVAGADSRIYSVDGNTLAATEIFQIDSSGQVGINEILFTGGDTMLANITGQLVQYNMATGTQTTIMTLGDYYNSGSQQASGLTRTIDDRLAFSVFEISHPTGTRKAIGMLDPFTGSYEEVSSAPADDVGYLDVFQRSSSVMLGMNWLSSHISVVDLNDGSLMDRFELSVNPVSFLELGGQLFILDFNSDLYAFNAYTGDTEFFGSISGVSGAPIGATSNVAFRIPAPGAPAALAIGALFATRRRR